MEKIETIVEIPSDLFNQISELLLHNSKLDYKELTFKISEVLMNARRRDKDSLIRELNNLIKQLKKN